MKPWLLLLSALASACASADLRSSENDPADPSATVAALDVGVGVLSSSFSPEQIAPEPGPADDPHAGHEHAGHEHAGPSDSATSDPHAGHEMPAASTSASTPEKPSSPKKPTAAPKKPAGPATATTYTCMHHPEVVSTTKGQCPKCGMDLVPKKPAASAGGGKP